MRGKYISEHYLGVESFLNKYPWIFCKQQMSVLKER